MGINNYNWKEFFLSSNEGLGTLYDRTILERFFERFISDHEIKNALDCPSFGMTGFSGINSMYLAKKGVEVTICDNNSERLEWIEALWKKIGLEANFKLIEDYSDLPFNNGDFDLVWNLSALWYLKEDNISSIIEELGRITGKCLFISVHNKNQLFYHIWKRMEPDFFYHIKEEYSDKEILEKIYNETLKGFNHKEEGYFVTTPWPGIILKKDQIFKKKVKKNNNFSLNEIKIPQYVDFLIDQKENNKINNLMFLEKMPDIFKKYWAHLNFWIFTK